MCLSGADSDSEEEVTDGCNHQQGKLSAQETLGKIDEIIENSETLSNESVRDLLSKLKNEVEKMIVADKSKNLKQSQIVSFFTKM